MFSPEDIFAKIFVRCPTNCIEGIFVFGLSFLGDIVVYSHLLATFSLSLSLELSFFFVICFLARVCHDSFV